MHHVYRPRIVKDGRSVVVVKGENLGQGRHLGLLEFDSHSRFQKTIESFSKLNG
jgi:hypothetical protein